MNSTAWFSLLAGADASSPAPPPPEATARLQPLLARAMLAARPASTTARVLQPALALAIAATRPASAAPPVRLSPALALAAIAVRPAAAPAAPAPRIQPLAARLWASPRPVAPAPRLAPVLALFAVAVRPPEPARRRFPPLSARIVAAPHRVVVPPDLRFTFTDTDGYDDILARLMRTGRLADAVFGVPAELMRSGSDLYPVAVLTPERWEESDREDPILLLRTAHYKLTILTREEDPSRRYRELDAVCRACQNALDGVGLEKGGQGYTLPQFTRLSAGKYLRPESPQQGVEMAGKFAYFVGDYGDRVDSEIGW